MLTYILFITLHRSLSKEVNMEELSLDNILTEDQIAGLFEDESTQETVENKDNTPEDKHEETETTEVNIGDYLESGPESVGSENTDEEDTDSTKGNTSPDFYSSIANALVEDGIFQNLDDTELSKIKTAEDFAELVSSQIKSQFDERQKRIDEALNVGVEPSDIQKYERYIDTLNGITEDKLIAESQEGENLRKNIIYQDYINRGMSKERALKYVERSFKAGTDIEDAKEALQSNKEFFNEEYKDLIEKAKSEEAKEKERQKKQDEEFKAAILDEKKAFGELEIDKATRQRVYDSITKPIYTDPETGERLTALQKYETENKTEFLKNIGLLYVLTDGFKKLDGLVQSKVKKEMKKGLRELEHTISNTSRNRNGNLTFASGVGDPESKSSKWDLDL